MVSYYTPGTAMIIIILVILTSKKFGKNWTDVKQSYSFIQPIPLIRIWSIKFTTTGIWLSPRNWKNGNRFDYVKNFEKWCFRLQNHPLSCWRYAGKFSWSCCWRFVWFTFRKWNDNRGNYERSRFVLFRYSFVQSSCFTSLLDFSKSQLLIISYSEAISLMLQLLQSNISPNNYRGRLRSLNHTEWRA